MSYQINRATVEFSGLSQTAFFENWNELGKDYEYKMATLSPMRRYPFSHKRPDPQITTDGTPKVIKCKDLVKPKRSRRAKRALRKAQKI